MKETIKRILRIVILSMYIFINYNIDVMAIDTITFRNITIEEGLSQASIETMIQDTKGYIWLGSNDGLNRYNGYEFKVFRQDKDNIDNTINHNYIIDIKEDFKGNIWVGTINGVTKISDSGRTIKNYNEYENQGNLSSYNTREILVLRDGRILVGTIDGLNIYNESEDKFYRIFPDEELSSQLIHGLEEDYDGNVWVSTNNGLNKVNIDNNTSIKYPLDQIYGIGEEEKIFKLYCDDKDNLWVGTFTKGALKINLKTGNIDHYFEESWGVNDIPGEHVRSFYKDSNGYLWIGTSDGLVKYDYEKDSFRVFKNKVYDRRSLIDNSVYSIMEDSSGMIWVGTYGGISIFNPHNTISHYKHDPFLDNSINDNMIQGLYEDDEGYIWVGTNTKGVNILNINKYRIAELNNYKLSSNRVNDIDGYKDYIFLGTNNGLNIIDKKNKSISILNELHGLPSKNIKILFVDDKDFLWIGTIEGVCVLNINTMEVIDLTYLIEKANTDDIYTGAIFQDSQGIYWYGNFLNGGLTKIDPFKNEVINYKYNKDDSNSLIDNSIRTINEDSKGHIWIGTSHGLCMFDKETNSFKRYTIKDGLPNNTIYGILVDSNDNIWVSTNLGLSNYNFEEDRFINFDVTDGLQSNEFNGESYLELRSGEFLFGGVNGLNSFNPSQVVNNNYISQVVFDEFFINGIKVNNIDKKKFKNEENNVKIEVFLPDYRNTKNIRFYYNLEGTNSEWTKMEQNSVLFSKLSPGKYNFRVVAINSNGIVSKENNVRFTISNPRWISIYAIIFYIFIILYLFKRNRNKVKILDRLVDEKTIELKKEIEKNNSLFKKVIELEKSKNSYFINLSHELRTPLNVLHSTEQLITKLNIEETLSKEKLNYYMEVVRRNNRRLLNLINNLIDISKLENGKYIIQKQSVDIVYLVEESALDLKEYVEKKGINFIIDPQIEEKEILCDPQDIERCIVNLIGNAIKFTPSGGTITVVIQDLDDIVRIIVNDTGCGIAKELHKSIFNRFNQVVDKNSEIKGGSGLGLTIVRQIVDLHGGRIYIESELGKGSSFIIELPCK